MTDTKRINDWAKDGKADAGYAAARDQLLESLEANRQRLYLDHRGLPKIGDGLGFIADPNRYNGWQFTVDPEVMKIIKPFLSATEYLDLSDKLQQTADILNCTAEPKYGSKKTLNGFAESARGLDTEAAFGKLNDLWQPTNWDFSPSAAAIKAVRDYMIQMAEKNCIRKFFTTSFKHGRVDEWFLYAMFGVFLLGGCEAAQPQSRKVEMLCGNYTWAITCGRDNRTVEEDSRECNKNILSIRGPDGKKHRIPDPPMTTQFHDDKRSVMIEGTTPTAMSCLNKIDASYVSVEYSRGSGPVGLFLDDFTSSGQRLTSVGVPVKRPYISPFKGVKWSQLQDIRIEGEK